MTATRENATPGLRVGVDLGGTKTEAVALGRDGEILVRTRQPTPRSYDASVEAVARLVEEVESEAGGRGSVGIGIPGTLSRATGRVINANSTWLLGHPLDRDLAHRLRRPVRVMNDANCFALSEAVDGAGAGARVVFGVILGTGVGGGLVVDGSVLTGAQGIAGEWGHNPLHPEDAPTGAAPACYCGRRGCVERWLSGPALQVDHQRVTGEDRTPEELAEAAARGEPAAQASLDRWTRRLGRALASVVNVLDPDVVVLGGGLSNLPEVAERAQEALAPHLFTDHPETRVVRNVHGDSSGVRGAAWLWGGPDGG